MLTGEHLENPEQVVQPKQVARCVGGDGRHGVVGGLGLVVTPATSALPTLVGGLLRPSLAEHSRVRGKRL